VQPDWKLDGVNLLPYLTGEKTDAPHEALYWRFGQQIAIRKGDWKLVKAPGGGAEAGEKGGVATTQGAQLYNLAKDLGEQTNLADKEPEKLKELAADWDAWNRGNIPAKWAPGRPRAVAEAEKKTEVSKPASTAAGPWKAGDSLAPASAPQVAGRALTVSAQIDPSAPEGVIVAQGGPGNGYALYLHDGKLAFAVRIKKQLTTVSAAQPVSSGSHVVSARLATDGKITLLVDGNTVGEGHAPGPINAQPQRGLTIGSDGSAAVGEYKAPNTFAGKLENVSVRAE
jgi:hypothetical protein